VCDINERKVNYTAEYNSGAEKFNYAIESGDLPVCKGHI
jgi:hypothetical protein